MNVLPGPMAIVCMYCTTSHAENRGDPSWGSSASPQSFGDFRHWELKSVWTWWGPALPAPAHGKDCSPSSFEVTPLTHSCEMVISPSLCRLPRAVPNSVNPTPDSLDHDLPCQPRRSWQKKQCRKWAACHHKISWEWSSCSALCNLSQKTNQPTKNKKRENISLWYLLFFLKIFLNID